MDRRSFLKNLLGLGALAIAAPALEWLPAAPTAPITPASLATFSAILKQHYLDASVIETMRIEAGPLLRQIMVSEFERPQLPKVYGDWNYGFDGPEPY